MKIVHSKRKTIALIIEQDGSLTVRAPMRLSRLKIEQLIAEKANWIRERQEWARMHYPAAHQYEEGELFYFLGKTYPLKLVPHQNQSLLFNNSFILDRTSQSRAQQLFINWYRDQARQVFGERTCALASHYDLAYSDIHISSARTRWGSCSNRATLNFSWRLVMAPLEVIDYVITHELAHLKIPNHSAAFWKYVEQLSPNYRALRKWLKENGSRFNL
jgi:predicted metal-dependent hydrolase